MADKELREQVRIRLIQCRNEHELTQTEVGKIVGKSKNAVASWEQGLSLPDAVTLYKLAKYYGKDMSYMYGEE
jgi:transcriptional regulator with XRE-family HTH domain